jgi:hypothetical protein
MPCGTCFDIHTTFTTALACYRAATPPPPGSPIPVTTRCSRCLGDHPTRTCGYDAAEARAAQEARLAARQGGSGPTPPSRPGTTDGTRSRLAGAPVRRRRQNASPA